MPNSVVDLYRQKLAEQGAKDDRTDDEITQQFGALAQAQAPELFKAYPDFGQDWSQIREANAPSLGGEVADALKSGTHGLISTYAGLGALALAPSQPARPEGEVVAEEPNIIDMEAEDLASQDVGTPTIKPRASRKKIDAPGVKSLPFLPPSGQPSPADQALLNLARSQAEAAASPDTAPTIPSMEAIDPGEPSKIKRLLSKDALRYAAGKLGGMAPAAAEMVGTATAGGIAGSALEPGVGTVAGALEGAGESIFGRGIIKNAIKSLLKKGSEEGSVSVADQLLEKGVIKEASEDGIQDAIRAGSKDVVDEVTKKAKQLAGAQASHLTNLANAYGMSAGGIYNETGRQDLALGFGALAAAPMAIPELSLPTQVIRKLFPKLSADAAQSAAGDLIKSKTSQLLSKLGKAGWVTTAGTGNMVAMDAAGIVAKNIADGREALDLTPEQWKQLRESAVGGALASAPFGAIAGFYPDRTRAAPVPPPEAEAAEPTAAAQPVEPAALPQEQATPAATPASGMNRILSMEMADKQARLQELSAKPDRSPDEENEYQVLAATTPKPEAAPVVAPPPPAEPASGLQPLPSSTKITVHGVDKAGKPIIQIDIPHPDADQRSVQDRMAFSGTPEQAAEAGYAVPGLSVGTFGIPEIGSSAGEKPPAPAVFAYMDAANADELRAGKSSMDFYHLTEPIPGHGLDSTVSRSTLEKAGYAVPPVEGLYGDLHVSDAGFKSHDDFLDAYRKNAVHDAFETAEEFLSRIYCIGQAA